MARQTVYEKIWTVREDTGPNQLRVIEEHNKVPKDQLVGEEGMWFMAWMDALIQDADMPIDFTRLENPS